jgi:hypothetical protein
MPVQQSNRAKVLADFADNVVRLSKINIGKTYTAYNSKGKPYKKRIDSSGKLRKSIKAQVKQRNDDTGQFEKARIVFSMLKYGIYVDKGRKRGKGIPMQPLIDWINKKPLKIRDLETGSFIKKTESRVKGLAYVISRNAKRYGIPATNFFTDAYNSQEKKFYDQLQEAIANDQLQYISQQLDLLDNAD